MRFVFNINYAYKCVAFVIWIFTTQFGELPLLFIFGRAFVCAKLKLYLWPSHNCEDLCFFLCLWCFNRCLSIRIQMRCYSICFAIMLIRFRHLVNFQVSIINRCIHTRTSEGDGEKPSRHENEGPLQYSPFILCLWWT